MDRLAQRSKGVQQQVHRHQIPAGEIQLNTHHVKINPRFDDGLEVAQRTAQMLRQRAVAVVPPRDVLRERQADVDNRHRLVVPFAQCVGRRAGEVNQLFLRQLEAICPVVRFVHGVPVLNRVAVGADVVARDVRGFPAQFRVRQTEQPLRVHVLMPEPERVPLGGNSLVQQKRQCMIHIRIVVAVLLRHSRARIERNRCEVERLREKLRIAGGIRRVAREVAAKFEVASRRGKRLCTGRFHQRALRRVNRVRQRVQAVVRRIMPAVRQVLQFNRRVKMPLRRRGQRDTRRVLLRMVDISADGLRHEVHKFARVPLPLIVRHHPQIPVERHRHLDVNHVRFFCHLQADDTLAVNRHAALVRLKVHAGRVGAFERLFIHRHSAEAV